VGGSLLQGIEVPSAGLPEADRGRVIQATGENSLSEGYLIILAGHAKGCTDGTDSPIEFPQRNAPIII